MKSHTAGVESNKDYLASQRVVLCFNRIECRNGRYIPNLRMREVEGDALRIFRIGEVFYKIVTASKEEGSVNKIAYRYSVLTGLSFNPDDMRNAARKQHHGEENATTYTESQVSSDDGDHDCYDQHGGL